MNCLITGGAGFIGSHLADALLARGDRVILYDNFASGSRENIAGALDRGAELIEADIMDREALSDALARFAPETLVHLAAQGEIRRSIRDPALDARLNVEGLVNVLEASRDAGVSRVVFASSGGAVYGEGEGRGIPLDEETPLEPRCPYGLSKAVGERYLELYRLMHGLGSVALRFGNVYGPRQNPYGEAGAIAIFGELLLEGKRPTVFGDGRQTRDFVYIDDLTEALMIAIDSLGTEPVNLGSGTEVSLLELLEALGQAARSAGFLNEGDRFDPVFEPGRNGEVRRIALDPARADELFGWSSTTTLDVGLARTLRALASPQAVTS